MRYRKILFVCSGNLCRSPMAVATFEDMARKDPELHPSNIIVKSAGTLDLGRQKATDEAIQIMLERGLDISQHRSTHIDEDLVDWADVILVMQHKHKEYIVGQFLPARDKTHLLTHFAGGDGEVADPIGRGIETYRDCANQLSSLLGAILERMKS